LSTGPSLLFHFLPLLLEHLLSHDENAALHLVAGLLTIIPLSDFDSRPIIRAFVLC